MRQDYGFETRKARPKNADAFPVLLTSFEVAMNDGKKLQVRVSCCVLQCIAACCSALQCVVLCCGMLQCVAVRCSVLQCIAVCCSVLQ